jgi:futalosine hydrolase
MRVLIVTATEAEAAPAVATLGPALQREPRLRRHRLNAHDVDVLTTGVGMVPTAARVSQRLSADGYDLALNVGVCGSFDPTLAPGMVVHVISDRLPELGAEDGDAFLTAEEIGLVGHDEAPFTAGALVNARPPRLPTLASLPQACGITVNTVHGRDTSIAAIVQRCRPQVESMEGAAFMYACLIHDLPFAQIRAISNVVERRNRNAWKLSNALEALGRTTAAILHAL